VNARDVTRRLRNEPRLEGLTRSARAVYRVLLEQARDHDGMWVTRPLGDQQLQLWTSYGRTAVKDARRELVDAGLIAVHEPGSGRARSRYLLRGVTR
jgi:hypothetical protein